MQGETAFPLPSLLLAKATHQLQMETSIKKTAYKYLSVLYWAPFCSSENPPNRQHFTKHWGPKAEQETQCIQQTHPANIRGQLHVHDGVVGALPYSGEELTHALVLWVSAVTPKDTEASHWGRSSQGVLPPPCYWCFISVFQNNISE